MAVAQRLALVVADREGFSAMDLGKLPTFVINLERRKDRRENMKALTSSLGLRKTEFIKAVDGKELLSKHSGRLRCESAKQMLYKLSWNSESKGKGVRESQLQKLPPKHKARKAWDLWGFLGCNRSHMAVWQTMSDRGIDMALVLEDDCHLLCSAAEAKERICAAVKALDIRFPRWSVCYLGGSPLEGPGRPSNDACGIRGLRHARCVYQAHAYILRQCADVVEFWRSKMLDKGLIVDNAMVAWQRTAAAATKSFWCCGPQLLQQGNFGSDLLLLADGEGGPAGWKKTRRALASRKYLKRPAAGSAILGSFGRGVRPIPRPVRRRTLKQRGCSGGRVCAGGGSTAADVAKKEAWLLSQRARLGGTWPPARVARDKKGISFNLYYRLARAHSAS